MMDRLEFVAPDGTVTVLTDLVDDVDVRDGVSGRFAPPVLFDDEEAVGRDGSRLRNVRAGVRDIVLPLSIEPSDEPALRLRLRQLVSALWPARGSGTLRSVRGSVSRQIAVRYAGGLEIVEDFGSAITGWVNAGLVLRAFDPFWEDGADVEVLFSAGVQPTFLPFPPLDLAASATVGTATIVNGGDAEAWPVWKIVGPGGPVELSNAVTGDVLELSTVLGPDETLTVDTRPGRKTIRDGDGNNLYGDRASGSSLWPLVRGDNVVDVLLADATEDSSVRLSYRRRWLSA